MTIFIRIRKRVEGMDWPPPDPLPDGFEWPATTILKARDDQEQAVWDRAWKAYGDPTKRIGGPELPRGKK